jgi:hypothetical protein
MGSPIQQLHTHSTDSDGKSQCLHGIPASELGILALGSTGVVVTVPYAQRYDTLGQW